MLSNIYEESKDYYGLIAKNQEEDNIQKLDRFESMIEENAVLVFAFPTDTSVFQVFIPKSGKIGTGHITQKITEVLMSYKAPRIRLLNLYSIVNEVYSKVEDFPSVKKKLKTEYDKNQFLQALSYLVARQILVHRCQLGRLTNQDLRSVVNDYLDITNSGRGIFQAVHQASNKLIEGKLSPSEVRADIGGLLFMKRKELAQKAIAYNGGYLGRSTDMIKTASEENEIIKLNFTYEAKPKSRKNDLVG